MITGSLVKEVSLLEKDDRHAPIQQSIPMVGTMRTRGHEANEPRNIRYTLKW